MSDKTPEQLQAEAQANAEAQAKKDADAKAKKDAEAQAKKEIVFVSEFPDAILYRGDGTTSIKFNNGLFTTSNKEDIEFVKANELFLNEKIVIREDQPEVEAE